AYWVGLVGIHSVFPAGLRPERLRAGPIAREVLQRRWVDMDTAIERADNRATVVFGLGVGVAAVVLPITLMVAVVYGLVLAGCWLAGRLDLIPVLFLVGVGAVLAPFFLVTGIDRIGRASCRDRGLTSVGGVALPRAAAAERLG